MNLIFPALNAVDLGLLLLRLILGVFFILARFRWFYNPSATDRRWFSPVRHAALRDKLQHCGWGDTAWLPAFVATVEILAALGVIFGFMLFWSAAALATICIIGTMCTACDKTQRQNPVDDIDWWSCYLWTPEPIYLTVSVVLVLSGAGLFSLDALILWALR